MPRTPRTLSVTAGSVAVVGLLASPATACLDLGPAGATTTAPTAVERVVHRFADATLTQDEFRALLDAKLDRWAAKAAALQARWGAVGSGAVLTRDQRSTAFRDLARALAASARLGSLPTAGALSASVTQQAQIDSLRADLAALVAQLKALLANRPGPEAVKPLSRAGTFGAGQVSFDRHRCDGDGSVSFDRSRFFDGHRDWHR